MKLTIRTLCCLLMFVVCSFSYGQLQDYNYIREIKGVSEQWHKIILPDEIFGKTSHDLSDIRIFGITPNSDTVEAPYLLRLMTEKNSSREVAFKILNASHNSNGYYFTFEIPTTEPINQIDLDFKESNFDWKIKLQGSQNQNEWFTVIENYRILSIKNDLTDFQFTKLTFLSSKYRYFRLLIESKEKPELNNARITLHETIDGTFRNYIIKKFKAKENKQTKQTEIDVEMQLPVPVSHIRIDVLDTFDYYRPLTIKYLTDSFKTEQGWKYNYHTLRSGTLNSIEENEFQFSSTTVHKLKILVNNYDNQPLTIDTIHVKGYIHELVTRCTDQTNYFLTYGNKRALKPQYDIDHFTDNIPETLTALALGDELAIEKEAILKTGPLFKNMIWLWTVMIVLILLLGWFSVKMIRKN